MAAVVATIPPGPPADEAPRGEHDVRRVDAEFTASLGAFARQVRRMRVLPVEPDDAEVRRALGLLAEAIEHVPGAEDALRVTAAQRIRAYEGRIALGMPARGADARPLVQAIGAASQALGRMAEGPYRGAPQVAQRMAELEETLDLLRELDRMRPARAEALAALERAALVMTAMHAAVARGEVGGHPPKR